MADDEPSPGPWKIRAIGKAIDIVAADGRYIASLSSREERVADAMLMVSAPTLKKQNEKMRILLKAAATQLEIQEPNHKEQAGLACCCNFCFIISNIRDLLAK